MSDHSQDTAATKRPRKAAHRIPQHPNAPFGKLSLVKSPFNHGGGYIGCYSEVGDIFAGFAEIDPTGGIRALTDVDKTATALIACWNACADAGLTVEQLESGIIKKMMDENAANAAALRCDICGTEIVGHPWHGQTEATKATHYCDACRPPAQADTALRQAAQNMVDTAFELTATLRRSCCDCVIYNDDNEADVCSHAASVVFARTAVIKALAPITTEPTNG